MLLQRTSRALVARIHAMSTQSAAAVAVKSESEAHNEDADQPLWEISNPYEKERRECLFCMHKVDVNYKNVQLISQFVSPYTGKLYDRHITGLCLEQQKRLRTAHVLAKRFLLMPSYFKELKYVRDPKLIDPFRPQRPNPH